MATENIELNKRDRMQKIEEKWQAVDKDIRELVERKKRITEELKKRRPDLIYESN